MPLIDFIKGRTVKFQYFRDNNFIYKVDFPGGLTFAVPLSDVGTATFKDKDKAIYFMKWIAKAFERRNKSEEPNHVLDYNLGYEEVKLKGDIKKAMNDGPFVDITDEPALNEALARQLEGKNNGM